MRNRMSENEKIVFFIVLFPPLWPFGIAWAVAELCVATGKYLTNFWKRF